MNPVALLRRFGIDVRGDTIVFRQKVRFESGVEFAQGFEEGGEPEYEELSLRELQTEAEKAGVAKSGTKAEIIERLRNVPEGDDEEDA
jgi:hypothetical protein